MLRDTSKPEAARKAAAAAIWRKLIEAKPKDPVTVAQVADLFRQAEMTDDALALYRQAIELAPNDAQYREYLGEYLHALKRSDEAMAVWARIAEGPDRNARSLTRLAEVLSGFGYVRQAIAPMSQALELDRDNFDLGMKLAELLHRAERYDDARARLVAVEKLAESDEEKAAALEAQVKNDQAAGVLAARAEALRLEVEKAGNATAAAWSRSARATWRPTASSPRPAAAPSPRRSRSTRGPVQAWAPRRPGSAVGRQPGRCGRFVPPPRRDRPPQPDRVPPRRSPSSKGPATGPDRPGDQGRPRPDRRGAGQPRALRVLRRTSAQPEKLGKPDDGLDALRRIPPGSTRTTPRSS